LGVTRKRSQKRSFSASDHGVAAARLSARGYGEGRPIVDNATARGRAMNRRVEIIIRPTN
jgi:outer membrane protein OmpA-like peptidoglycan-associated protein